MDGHILSTSSNDCVASGSPGVTFSSPPQEERDKKRAALLSRLSGEVESIDVKGVYPHEILRDLGELDTYNVTHYDHGDPQTSENLFSLFNFHSQIAKICLNTAFCVWCQTACSWYLLHTPNRALQKEVQDKIERGKVLSGTGLSNPMKAVCQIEEIRLKGKAVPGGYRVSGYLPWVSNITEESFFGAVISLEGGNGELGNLLAGLIHCHDEGVSLNKNQKFVALNGSATVGVRLHEYFLPHDRVLAEDGETFLDKVRPGFIYFQMAMSLGNARAGLNEIHSQFRRRKNLPEKFKQRYQKAIEECSFYEEKTSVIANCLEKIELREILQLRLSVAYLSQEVANLLLINAGAAGYLNNTSASRKIREAHFVSIVTPSITQLEIMLEQLG